MTQLTHSFHTGPGPSRDRRLGAGASGLAVDRVGVTAGSDAPEFADPWEVEAGADADGTTVTEPAENSEPDDSTAAASADAAGSGDTAPVRSRRSGETTIADEVIEKVAAIAIRKVAGVHDLGGGNGGRGVTVTLTGRAAKLAVTLTVTYGHPVYDVADQVREQLAESVEHLLGLEVTEVDVVVEDIHLPEESA